MPLYDSCAVAHLLGKRVNVSACPQQLQRGVGVTQRVKRSVLPIASFSKPLSRIKRLNAPLSEVGW